MDSYDTLFVGGSRCGWSDILKIRSFYLTWIYMNGFSSSFLQSEGRKILRQAWSSRRCLADGPPKALPSSSTARFVPSLPLGPQLWTHTPVSHTLHCSVWVRGSKTLNAHWIKGWGALADQEGSLLSFSNKPQRPPGCKEFEKVAPTSNSALRGRIFPSVFLQAISWVHYCWVYGESNDSQ